MKSTMEINLFLSKKINDSYNQYQNRWRSSALVAATSSLGLLLSMSKEDANNESFIFALILGFSLPMTAIIYTESQDPRTLLEANISAEEKDALAESDILELCDCIRLTIIN